MNLLHRKMHFLGSYHHDFSRLAKQSGFFFQSYRGRVNWSEIESLNLDEITEDRNFELLERNLLNVINCNLERDYDLKILDKNFVKVFKIAQLGIDYLSYCEMYLDRCVVLLQEQIIALQEEVESLKNENEGKNSELRKIKAKTRIHNYQCEKCAKVFISDVYLKFHDKRRHSNMTTPKSEDGSLKKLTDAYQQTETERKLSVSIQTVFEETHAEEPENEHLRKIKKIHNKKMKRLEENLNDLKARLQKTEKALEDTREANSSSATFSFPSSNHYHPHLQFIPPCCLPPQSITEVIPKNLLPKRRSPVALDVHEEPEASGDKCLNCGRASAKYNANGSAKSTEDTKIDLIVNKENLDPQSSINVTKPLPPPRRSKKKIPNTIHENLTLNAHNQLSNDSQSMTSIPFIRQTDIQSPVSLKGEPEPNKQMGNFEKIKEAFLEEVNSKKFNSNDSLYMENPEEFRLFFKKVVAGSPKLQKLRRNLQKPLTNFYHSVSSTGKDLMKIENKLQTAKNVLTDGLNNQLRSLGIDPEWKGIPKKTMKQKLKRITHRRKLLTKENPSYLSVRQNAEEKLFKKIRKNFFTRKVLKNKSLSQHEMEEEIDTEDENPDRTTNQQLQNDRNSTVLYDTHTDSEKSDFESNPVKQSYLVYDVCSFQKEQTLSDSDSEELSGGKKFDISMFQIKKRIVENKEEKSETEMHKANEELTNSDLEDYF